MAMGDVYEVVDVQRLYGQEVLNVYYYEQAATVVGQTVTSSELLWNAFNQTFIPAVINVQGNDILHTAIRVRNLFNDGDRYQASISTGGARGDGDGSPSFSAVSFSMTGDNGAVRNGAKRIGGMWDGLQSDGVIVGAPIIADLTAFSNVLHQSITPTGLVGISNLFVPVIVKRIRSGTAGNYTYRLPDEVGEKVVSHIVEALFNLIVGHQVSRAIGIGV